MNLIKLFFTLTTLLLTNHYFSYPMSMSFIIFSDNATTNCEESSFPYKLGYFCEEIGKLEETSEFKQVEQILNINLSFLNFNNYKFDNEGEPLENWFNIDSTIEIINKTLEQIKLNPEFYNQIVYDTNFNSYDEWRSKTDSVFNELMLAQIQYKNKEISENDYKHKLSKLSNLEYSQPFKNDYLSKGDFKADLISLNKILKCYKSNGAKNFGIMYM